MPDYRFPDHPGIDPAETAVPIRLSLFNLCANFWRPNEQYNVSETIRPEPATGFAYQNAGGVFTSGARQPIWSRTLAGTTPDGSGAWTTIAAGENGLNAMTSPSAISDPVGLTIGATTASESTEILTTYSGGQAGQAYDAVFTFTLNGATRVARQRVPVKKR